MAHVMIHATIKPLANGDPAVQVLIEEKVPLVPTRLDAFSEIDFEATRAVLAALLDATLERMREQLETIESAESARRSLPREVAGLALADGDRSSD
jgi:hypothetical protein